jgi:hypothetical protein
MTQTRTIESWRATRTLVPARRFTWFAEGRSHCAPSAGLKALCGVLVRENRDDATERYVPFFADEPTAPSLFG